MRLGVAGVLVKPLTPTLLRERLSGPIADVQAAVERHLSALGTGPRSEASLLRQLLDPDSPSVGSLLTTACRLVGDPLDAPMTVRTVHPQMTPTITSRWIFGSIHLHGVNGVWELCVHLPLTVALRLGSQVHQVTPDQLSSADLRDVVLNLALELGTRLREDGLKHGIRLRIASGRSGEQPAGALFRSLQHGPGMSRCLLGAQDDQPTGAIQLIAHATAAAV
jgi:hypothetical protein